MITIHPQFIKDSEGKNSFVVLPISEFDSLLEEFEDYEDVRLYDEAKTKDDGDRISLSEYLKTRQ
jgi:hypothetical protein